MRLEYRAHPAPEIIQAASHESLVSLWSIISCFPSPSPWNPHNSYHLLFGQPSITLLCHSYLYRAAFPVQMLSRIKLHRIFSTAILNCTCPEEAIYATHCPSPSPLVRKAHAILTAQARCWLRLSPDEQTYQRGQRKVQLQSSQVPA